MGVFEYLRKCVASITGRDPEETDSSALYRFYSQTTSGQMGLPTRGTVPFKHSVASPMQLPPGQYYSSTGQVTAPHLYDATMGDVIRVLNMDRTGNALSQGQISVLVQGAYPEQTIGAAIYSPLAGTGTDEWKWGRVAITAGAGGATNDTELVAAVASKKIQISILGVAYVAKADSATNNAAVITIQDSDNVQLSGAAVITLGCSYCNVAGAAMGNDLPHREWDLMRGPVAYSATNQRAIEADLAGCIQNDIVEVIYAWREF